MLNATKAYTDTRTQFIEALHAIEQGEDTCCPVSEPTHFVEPYKHAVENIAITDDLIEYTLDFSKIVEARIEADPEYTNVYVEHALNDQIFNGPTIEFCEIEQEYIDIPGQSFYELEEDQAKDEAEELASSINWSIAHDFSNENMLAELNNKHSYNCDTCEDTTYCSYNDDHLNTRIKVFVKTGDIKEHITAEELMEEWNRYQEFLKEDF